MRRKKKTESFAKFQKVKNKNKFVDLGTELISAMFLDGNLRTHSQN